MTAINTKKSVIKQHIRPGKEERVKSYQNYVPEISDKEIKQNEPPTTRRTKTG
jgi:hypothetical protein